MSMFSDFIKNVTPPVEEIVVDSYVAYKLSKVEEYINALFSNATLASKTKLKYEGYIRASPHEEFQELTQLRKNKRTFDIAESNVYLCRFMFSYDNVPLAPKNIYLPYLKESSLITFGGTRYVISPMLANKVISIGTDTIFVSIVNDKLNFKRVLHDININGVNEKVSVIYSAIYRNLSVKVPKTTKSWTSIIHYMLARYGYSEAMSKLLGFVPTVVDGEPDPVLYPPEQWVTVSSSRICPRTYIGCQHYRATKLRVLVRNEDWNNQTKNIVSSLYYVFDHFPSHVNSAMLDRRESWMVLLGHCILSGKYSVNKLYESMVIHFASLEKPLDTIVQDKLKDVGFNCSSIFDIFAVLLCNFNDFIMMSEDSTNNLYLNKNYEVDYHALAPIIQNFNKFLLNLSKEEAKKQLALKDVEKLFAIVTTRRIFEMRLNDLIASVLDYSGDNYYPKILALVNEQEANPVSNSPGSRKSGAGSSSNKKLHASAITVGCLLSLPKKKPTPVVRMNPYVNIDPITGTILPPTNQEHHEIINRTQLLLAT